jgi:hypothetical protein
MSAILYLIALLFIFILIPIFAIHSLIRLFKDKDKNIKFLIDLLIVMFCVSFFSCFVVIIYYIHFYLGNNGEVLQKIYFGLFYLSMVLLVIIVVLKIIWYCKKHYKLW